MAFGAMVMPFAKLPVNSTANSKAKGNTTTVPQPLYGQMLGGQATSGFNEILSQATSKQIAKKVADLPETQQKQGQNSRDELAIEQIVELLQSLQVQLAHLQNMAGGNPIVAPVRQIQENGHAADVLANTGDVLGQIKLSLENLRAGTTLGSGEIALSFDTLKQHLLDLQDMFQKVADKQAVEPAIQKILQSIQGWQTLTEREQVFQGNEKNVGQLQLSGFMQLHPVTQTNTTHSLVLDRKTLQVSDGQKQSDKLENFIPENLQSSDQLRIPKELQAPQSANQLEAAKKSGTDQLDPVALALGQNQMGNNPSINLPEKIPVSSFAETLQQYLDPQMLQHRDSSLQTDSNGSFQFRVKLIPEGLGEVHLMITGTDSQMSVQLTTATDQARQLLDAQAEQLRELLSAKGINCNSIQVATGIPDMSFAFSQSDNQQKRQWDNRSNGKNAKALAAVSDVAVDDNKYQLLIQQHTQDSMIHTPYHEAGNVSVIDTTA